MWRSRRGKRKKEKKRRARDRSRRKVGEENELSMMR